MPLVSKQIQQQQVWTERVVGKKKKKALRQPMRFKGQHTAWAGRLGSTHVISSVLKLMIVEMKFSRISIPRSCLQSSSPSPSNTQMDSTASLTAAGGLARVRTSTRCCFLIALTAVGCGKGAGKANNSAEQNTSSRDQGMQAVQKRTK